MPRRFPVGFAAASLFVLALAAAPVACATARGQDQSPGTLRSRAITRLHLDKSDHRLDAFGAGGRRLASFRVAIGSGGLGPKRSEGDGRTPEGQYRIDSRHHSAQFHRFLHVSYPSRDDRAAFARLVREGTLPPSASIGGDIGIHGTGGSFAASSAQRLGIDWTAGCIAVDDDEIESLYRAVRPQAELEIVP